MKEKHLFKFATMLIAMLISFEEDGADGWNSTLLTKKR